MKFKTIFFYLFLNIFLLPEGIKYNSENLKIEFDEAGNIKKIYLEGDVNIYFKNMIIKTQSAIFNGETNEIETTSETEFIGEYGIFKADYIKYNFTKEEGVIKNSKFKINSYYGKGEEILRFQKLLVIKDGYITTCDLENPHYKICIGKIEYFKDEFFKIENIRIKLGNSTLFYFPKYTIDVKSDKPFMESKIEYKTKYGTFFVLNFNHKFMEKGDFIVNNSFLLGPKGIGTELGLSSENENLKINSLFLREWKEKDVKTGIIIEQNKNYKNVHYVLNWRWMFDNEFFKNFFENDFDRKSMIYNYFGVTNTNEKRIIGFSIRENAQEKNLNIEKLPEIRFYIPYTQILNIPLYYSYDLRFTNFYKEDENYFRILNRIDITHKKNLGIFTMRPFVSFSLLNYLNENKDKTNFVSEEGIIFSSYLIKEPQIIFTPSLKFFTRNTKYNPDELIYLDDYEEKIKGNFIETNLRWEWTADEKKEFFIEINNEYDIDKKELNDLNLRFDFKNGRIGLEGENRWDLKDGEYLIGVNSFFYETEKYKFIFGMRYDNKEEISGIEIGLKQKINEDFGYKLRFLYDFKSEKFLDNSFEIWKNIHCLTLNFKISKEDKFKISFLISPTLFLKDIF